MLEDISHEEKYISAAAIPKKKQINGLLISFSTTLNPIHTAIHYPCSAAGRLTGLKRFTVLGMACLLYKRYDIGQFQWPQTSVEAKQISE